MIVLKKFKEQVGVEIGLLLILTISISLISSQNAQAACNCEATPSASFEIVSAPNNVGACGNSATMVVKLRAICDDCLNGILATITDSSNNGRDIRYIDPGYSDWRSRVWPGRDVETTHSGGNHHATVLYSFTQQINETTTMWANAQFTRNGCHCCAVPGGSACESWNINRGGSNGSYCYRTADIGTVSQVVSCDAPEPPNTPPTAIIDTPTNGANFTQGDNIVFTGHANDSDGSIIAYQWCQGSCTNGGTQMSASSSFNYSYFPTGNYTIYFRAQDDDGEWSEQDSVNLTINAPIAPTVDLKINNSDGPLNVTQGNNLNIVWNSSNTNPNSCNSTGSGWNNSNLSTSGSTNITAGNDSNYSITCSGPGGNASDSVYVDVSCTPWCGNWSNCSAECDGGTQSRSCINASCTTYNDTQTCNTDPCSHNINWKEIAP